ncbi:hypothetical protein EON81_18230 [bacterium]|nr:MAG: hypothetical protein EON81_18230 [bacterium]
MTSYFQHEDTAPGIVLRSIDELILWDRNYRNGDVEAIVRSLERFGFRRPLSFGSDDTVITGNHTLMGLRQIKDDGKPRPKRVIEGPGGDWFVACVDCTDLPYEEQVAYAIADNVIGDLATNDEDRLNALIREIGEVRPDLTSDFGAFGLSLPEIALPDMPEFEPTGPADQGRFGEPRRMECPHCGEEIELA